MYILRRENELNLQQVEGGGQTYADAPKGGDGGHEALPPNVQLDDLVARPRYLHVLGLRLGDGHPGSRPGT